MTNYNTGSIIAEIFNTIDNIPSTVSGTVVRQVDGALSYCQEFLQTTINGTSFDGKYYDPILHKAKSSILQDMSVQGTDASTITLGDLHIGKGGASNVDVASVYFAKLANEELNNLRQTINFSQTYG